MDDDLALVEKRYHRIGETRCLIKINNAGECGYLYKSMNDYNLHIRSCHLEDPKNTRTNENEHPKIANVESNLRNPVEANPIFESPETSPAEKKSFNFEEHQLQPMSSQYNLASDNVTNSRNVQHSLSTPPLTPKPNCNIDLLPSDQNNANGKRICRNIQQNPAIGHALQVDIGNSQVNIRKNTKHDLLHANAKNSSPLLQVAPRSMNMSNAFIQDDDRLKYDQTRNSISFSTTKVLLDSGTATYNNPDILSLVDKSPDSNPNNTGFLPATMNTSDTFSSREGLNRNPSNVTYNPFDLNRRCMNNSNTDPNAKYQWATISKNENIISSFNHPGFAPLQSLQSVRSVPTLKRQYPDINVDHCRNVGSSQVVNQATRHQSSIGQSFPMINGGNYNPGMQMAPECNAAPLIQHIPAGMQSPDHQVHSLHNFQYLHQWQQQQTTPWNLLNQQMPRFSNNSIINQQSNSHATAGSSPSNYIPSMVYGDYGPGTTPNNLPNLMENIHQKTNISQESVHPLNPLIQHVKSIVHTKPKAYHTYQITSANDPFHPSRAVRFPAHEQPDKNKCNGGSEHRCLATNCCIQGKRGVKRKRAIEKENLNAKQLEEMRNMEWEKREGYKCKVCDVRFPNQQLLIDHLSENKCRRNANLS